MGNLSNNIDLSKIPFYFSCRYLATGDLLQSFHYSYLLGLSTVDNIVKETCSVMWDSLSPIVLPSEISEAEWLKIAQEFEELWNFPHAIASIDGKHVRIQVHFRNADISMCQISVKIKASY